MVAWIWKEALEERQRIRKMMVPNKIGKGGAFGWLIPNPKEMHLNSSLKTFSLYHLIHEHTLKQAFLV